MYLVLCIHWNNNSILTKNPPKSKNSIESIVTCFYSWYYFFVFSLLRNPSTIILHMRFGLSYDGKIRKSISHIVRITRRKNHTTKTLKEFSFPSLDWIFPFANFSEKKKRRKKAKPNFHETSVVPCYLFFPLFLLNCVTMILIGSDWNGTMPNEIR